MKDCSREWGRGYEGLQGGGAMKDCRRVGRGYKGLQKGGGGAIKDCWRVWEEGYR